MQSGEFSDGSGLDLYDFNARNYDPQIGRFGTMDPLAPLMHDWSPYSFGFDNPIYFTAPTGMSPDDEDDSQPDSHSQSAVRHELQEEASHDDMPPLYFEGQESEASAKEEIPKGSSSKLEDISEEIDRELDDLMQDQVDGRGQEMDLENDGKGDGGKPSLDEMKKNPPNSPDYKAPKSGPQWVRNPNGNGKGWLDKKGRVWVPDDHNGTHAPHWDVQDEKGGGYSTVYPIVESATKTAILIAVGWGIWEGLKWGVGVLGAPEIGGGSLILLTLP